MGCLSTKMLNAPSQPQITLNDEPNKTPQPKHDSQRTVPAAVIDASDDMPFKDLGGNQAPFLGRETTDGATLALALKAGYAEYHTEAIL